MAEEMNQAIPSPEDRVRAIREREQSVCKHCQQQIRECTATRPDSTGQCKGYIHTATGSHFCERGVSEPASTGEQPTRLHCGCPDENHLQSCPTIFGAARPSGPSAPPVELPGPTGEGSSGHSWIEPAPSPTPSVSTPGLSHNHSAGSDYCPACTAAPSVAGTQPTPEERELLLAQFFPQGTPQVEEIAKRILQTVNSASEAYMDSGDEPLTEEGETTAIEKSITSILRPYFPSQTPDIHETMDGIIAIQQVQAYLISEDGKSQKGYFSPGGWAYEQLTRISNKLKTLPATPASTARTGGWPSAAEIHNRFCGHEGNICQACQLKDDAAPGSVPQAPKPINALKIEFGGHTLHVGREDVGLEPVPQAEPPKEEMK